MKLRDLRKFIGRFCDIVMEDGVSAMGKVVKIDEDRDGTWLVLDYGYAFRVDAIKDIKVVKGLEGIACVGGCDEENERGGLEYWEDIEDKTEAG